MRYALILAIVVAPTLAAQQDTAAARTDYEQGRSAMRERKFDDAAASFERATRLSPANPEYHLWLGHAYTRQLASANFIRKGIIGRRIGPQYDKAVELDSNNVEAARARVEFYLEAPGIAGGGVDKAKAEAARLRRLSAYHGAFAEAQVAEHEKDWERAQSQYRWLMETYADSSTPHYYFGRAAALSGRELSLGETALRKFLAMLGASDPQSRAVAHYRLGTIREREGDATGARAAYDSAVALSPHYEDAIAARKRVR